MNWSKHKNIYIIRILSVLVLSSVFFPRRSLASYQVEMSLPGAPTAISDPGQYIQYLLQFGFYLLAFLAVAMITYGGILYMIPNKMAEAKERIWGAVIGVVFLLCSFLILQTIDPNLLNLTPKKPTTVNVLKATTPQNIDSKMSQLKATIQTSYGCYLADGAEIGVYSSTEDCQKNCPNGKCSVKQIKETFFTCVQNGEFGQGYGHYATYEECKKTDCEKGGAAQCQYEQSIK